MVEREVVRKGSSPHRGFLSAHKSSFVSALRLFQPLFFVFEPLFFPAKSCSGEFMQSFVISDYLNVNVEMIRLEFCSKELLHFSARLWVIKTQMHKHMMGGDVCGKQGLCVQSQQLRVTSLKAAASRSLRGRRRGRAPPAKQLQLVLRRKTAAKQLLLLSHSRLGCQMLPLVRCNGIHCTIPS